MGDRDRFRVYREDIINHVHEALRGVDHEVFVTSPTQAQGLPGVVEAQNQLILRTLEVDFSHLWLIQADVEVPVDAGQRLLALNVDIAQGVVPRHDDHNALIAGFLDEQAKVWYLPRNAVEGQILTGWVFAGLSCTLIARRVLEAGIRFKYQPGIGEDILFMFDAQKAGFVAKVDGRVLCGHLPEHPLEPFKPKLLDVGCGHRPRGDVNVDLFVEATPHRCVDQRVNDDVRLDVDGMENFVRADALHLPFKDGAVNKSYSWHLIEHLADPLLFLGELMRVSAEQIEVRCPNGEFLSCRNESKPLHLHDFNLEWFREKLSGYPNWDFAVKWDYSQSEPWEIVVEGFRKGDRFD